MKKPFTDPWGFSKLDVYRTCPQKFEFQFIQKLPQPGSTAMERGSKMHEEIEHYLNGWSKELSPLVHDWKEALDKLKATNFKGEQALGFSKDWGLLPDWFDKRTWLRIKMDAYFLVDDELTVIDFKSGKYREPSTDQIELYAVGGHAMHPHVKKVNAQFWFLDADEIKSYPYTAEQLVQLRKKYEVAVQPMYGDVIFKPEPSRECKWCPYSKTKGGKCIY